MKIISLQDYSGSEEDYDESESVEEEEESSDETNAVKRKKNVKRKTERKKRPPASNSEEYDERDNESGEDYDDEGDGFAMPNVGEFFRNVGNMFTPVASYVPSFLFFGGKSSNEEDDDNSRDTLRPNLRRTKHKKSSQRYETPDLYLNRIEGAQEKTNRWYDSFFYGSTEEDDPTSTTELTSTTSAESEGFFDWLNGGSNEVETTESASAAPPGHSNQSELRTQSAMIILSIEWNSVCRLVFGPVWGWKDDKGTTSNYNNAFTAECIAKSRSVAVHVGQSHGNDNRETTAHESRTAESCQIRWLPGVACDAIDASACGLPARI